MAQVYLSQFSRRAGVADSASYVIGGGTPSPADTYIQYNKEDKFGAEVYFRYIYPIHSFQHGNNTNALGYWSHAEGSTTYTGFNNTFSSSILSGAVTLSAEYGNITSSFITGDYIYLNDYESDNIFSTTVAKIVNTSWDDTSSYVTLDVDNIHATTSFIGSLGTYYIQNSLGNKIARAYIAHSEGEGTYAMGVGAHSEGSGSYAIGKYSHVEGNNTVALGDYQTVVGQYNLFSTSQSAFIIGDGYAKIIDSGTFANSPTSGSFSFNINSTYSPLTDLTGSIITVVSASSSISETFIIDDVNDLGGGEYEIIVNRGITQDYYEDEDTFSILKITRHNLLFASQSYFQISASNVFLQGIPSSSTAPQVLIYDDETGQVYYTSSAAFGGVGSSPGGPDTSIQYNNNGNFNGIESFTLTSLHGGGTSVVRLTGSMLVSGSITSTGIAPNNVGFVGTASWAQSASNALQAVSASYAPNFANTDLTFTDNRDHHTNGYSYFIYSNLEGMAVSGGYQYFDNDSNSIGVAQGSTDTYTYIEIFTSSIDLSFNADPASPSAYTFTSTSASFSSSLNVTNSVFFPGLISASQPHLVVIDTASGKLFYLNSSSFGGNTFSGIDTRVVFYSGSTAISGSPSFTFNYTSSHLRVTGSTTLSGSTFIPGINTTAQQNVVTIDPTTGQLFYTSSNKLSAVSTPLDVQDDGVLVKSSPTFINFTGSGVSASSNGAGVNIFIPGGGSGTPGGSNTQIQFNGNGGFSGSANFTFISSSRIVNLTGSLNISGSTTLTGSMFVSGAISASSGANTVGFFGTASWAQSASNATSASYASTASAAPSDTFIQYNRNGLFGATGSFRYIYTSESLQQGFNNIAFGLYSHAEGRETIASGSYSHTEGYRVTASGDYSHAEGSTTKALGQYSHAEGLNTIAFGIYSHAEGNATLASGAYSHAEGTSTIAIGSNSHAEGQANTASGDYSHAEGYQTKALNLGSHAEGGSTIASGSLSHAEGRQTSSSGDYSHAEGYQTITLGDYSHAEGWATSASGDYSHAEGHQTTASGNYSHAEGYQTKTTNIGAHAEGTATIASNQFAHAEGNRTVASGQYSHAEGYLSSASNAGAHAEGYQTIALGSHSHTEGQYTLTLNSYSHTEGHSTTASGDYSHAEGFLSVTLNSYSHAEGRQTKAIGYASHAEGYYTSASGDYSHAEGRETKALGDWSHAEGYRTYTLNQYSHAEGNNTTADGDGSHAEGIQTTSSGDYSHAEGNTSKAIGNYSHVEGTTNVAFGEASHAEGIVNTASGNWSHAEGFGSLAGYTGYLGRLITTPSKVIEIYDEGDLTSVFTSNQLILGTNGIFNYLSTNYIAPTFSIQMDSDFNTSGTGIITDISNLYNPSLTSNGGNYSHAEGGSNEAIGMFSHAEGVSTIAAGYSSHAEGYYSIASRQYSHAEGFKTLTIGQFSHAEGSGSLASGVASHAEGRTTTASGDYSHAEGWRSIASGSHSHAEGSGSLAQGAFSHTAGNNTIALGSYQSVVGQFNVAFPSQSAFIIGDGTDNSNRRNVLFVSRSHFEVSASRTFLQGLSNTSQQNVLTYNPTTGQVYYTASSNLSAVSTPLDIRDDSIAVLSNPTFINFTGSGVSASVSSTGVNVFIPGGSAGSGDITDVIGGAGITVDNSGGPQPTASLNTSSAHFINGVSQLTGSLLTTSSFNSWTGSNTSQFAGTASYVSGSIFTSTNPALTASYALTASTVLNPYPINVTGSPYSTLYSVEPLSFQFGNPANTDYSIFFGNNSGFNAGLFGTAKQVIAIGNTAGANNQGGNINYSNFIGASAGNSSLFASQSNFIGILAGNFSYFAHNSNFIGVGAGQYQTYSDGFGYAPNSGSYSNYIGYGAGTGYYDSLASITRSPGRNNTVIGTSISLPNNTSNYVNLGGAFFISGTYFNDSPLTPGLGYSSNILTESINTSKVGINLWNPSYSLHVSGTVAFPNLTDTSQTNVVTINTTTGQLFYTASSAIGGGGGGGDFVPNSWTGSNASQFAGTSSYATFASAAYAAPSDTFIQYNSGGLFGATGSFRFIYTSQSLQQGFNTTASGQYSHAEGGSTTYNLGTLASGVGSHAEGILTIAAGEGSHAEGYGAATAPGALSAHAEGGSTLASGWVSHAEGSGTHAESYGSHAEGNQTTSSGYYSHTEGYLTRTIDPPSQPGSSYAHAEGEMTLASGRASHVEGYYNTASGDYQLVIGQYNVSLPSQSSFIIGDGINDNNRHNVLFVSRSHFEVSASNTYLQGLSDIAQSYVLTYNQSTGQVHYTASSNIGGGGGSGVTINNNTNNYLVTATGTSNTLDGEANLTFDGSSLKVIGNITASSFTGSFTGSLLGTASYADTASAINVTVSSNADEFLPVIVAYTGSSDGAKLAYIDNGFQYNPSSNILYLASAGALVAGNTTIQSVTATFGSATSQNNVVRITGSLNVSKSVNVDGAISASFGPDTVGFFGTASWAQSASFSPNFANTNLTFTNTRTHTGGGFEYRFFNSGSILDYKGGHQLIRPYDHVLGVREPKGDSNYEATLIQMTTSSLTIAVGDENNATLGLRQLTVTTSSIILTGSLNISGSITGSLFGTSSWATNALTASLWNGYLSTSSIIGNGLSSSFNINHGFNTRNLHITVYENASTGETVYPDIRRINENTASIIFANPPTENQYVVYISQ